MSSMLITSLALTVSAFTGGDAAATQPVTTTTTTSPPPVVRQDAAPTPNVITGVNGEILGQAANFDTALGGSLSSPMATAQTIRWLRPGVAEVQLGQTTSGWTETFVVGLPANRDLYAPLLVLFHGYGQRPEDLYSLTSYFQEARERGWFVVAPLGAHVYNYGIDYAQENTELALDWVAHHLPIDDERVYGVGFSMGGGWMTSYAARHVGPEHLKFAALVNHTGTTSIQDLYYTSADNSLFTSPLMFGGSPAEEAYRYCVASTMDWNSATGTTNDDTDIARNLANTPIKTFYAEFDPLQHIVGQCDAFHTHFVDGRGGNGELEVGTGLTTHEWSTLSETDVLDWLEPKLYVGPTTNQFNEVLVDRDATYWGFEAKQVIEGDVSPMRWYVHTGINRVQIDQVANLEEISFDANEIGLNVTGEFSLVLGVTDSQTVDVVIRGLSMPPSNVTRSGSLIPSWTWDPSTQELRITEFNGSTFPLWTIQS